MKKFFRTVFFIAITVLAVKDTYGQCKDCQIHPRRILRPEFNDYSRYYEEYIRKGDDKHSICVDFSKEAIIDFYNDNFSSSSVNDKWGVDIYFVSLKRKYRPGQKHDNQLGLVLVGSNDECKSQVGKLMIGNNTFDQSKDDYTSPVGRTWYTKEILITQKKRYFDKFAKNENYSTSVRFPLKNFTEFVAALQEPANEFKGLRFTFATYNSNDQACGQQAPNQITLMISPIKKDGDIGIEEFYNYLKGKLKHLSDKDFEAYFETLNHGTLCPTACPDEGR